jgi:hypothetical protein
MTWLTIIGYVFKALGFVEWAETLIQQAEARKKAQAVADKPVTDKEYEDAAKKGDL